LSSLTETTLGQHNRPSGRMYGLPQSNLALVTVFMVVEAVVVSQTFPFHVEVVIINELVTAPH